MSLYGLNDLRQLALPNGVDGDYLMQNRMKDGTTFEAVLNEMVQLVAAGNMMLLNDPLYSTMFYITDEDYSEYESGVAPQMQVRTELQGGDPQLVEYVSHTLPLKPYEYDLKWTRDGLMKANMGRLRRNLNAGVRAVKTNFEYRLLLRFFTNTDNQISGTGYDLPFANASSNVSYTPVNFDGQSFASTHTHFDRQAATAAGRETAVANGVDHLYEHGIYGPYFGIIPVADISSWTALDGTNAGVSFFTPDRTGLDFARDTDLTGDRRQEKFIGALNTPRGVVYLFATSRVPTAYFGMFAPFAGTDDERSALAVRYDVDTAFSAYVLGGAGFQRFPFEGAKIFHDFGVGSGGSRLNGYACYFNSSGNYVNPTINNG